EEYELSFFFQAEDGIRDKLVTGVQTCALPIYVLDYEARFKEAVIDRFAESYAAGETPVPCVECNRSIKFADLLGTARELGARVRSEEHTSELQSLAYLVCRLLLEKKK